MGGDWSGPTALVKADENSYSQLPKTMVWGLNHRTMHMAGPIYGDDPLWAYKIAYMKSKEFGQNWTTYDGDPVTLPALESTIDTIQASDPLLRSEYASGSSLTGGHLAVDLNNIPYVLYSDLSAGGAKPHQAWLATPGEQGGWDKILINDKISVLPEGWGLTTDGIHIDSNGHIGLLFTWINDLTESPDFGVNSNEVIWAESTDNGQRYTSQIIAVPAMT